jgi:hypothetical protein
MSDGWARGDERTEEGAGEAARTLDASVTGAEATERLARDSGQPQPPNSLLQPVKRQRWLPFVLSIKKIFIKKKSIKQKKQST